MEARQGFYAATAVDNDFDYVLRCPAKTTDIGDVLQGVGVEHSNGAMSAAVFEPSTSSNEGHLLQLGDVRVLVYEERVEEPNARTRGFTSFGRVTSTDPGSLVAHFAWAVWDGEVDCTLTVEGVDLAIRSFSGQQAIYVGPEVFGAGAFYQDGPTQASAGRIFARPLSGGPVFGRLTIGNQAGLGHVMTTGAPWPQNYFLDCYWNQPCSFGRPSASNLAVQVTGLASDGWSAQTLWLIDVPPSS